MRLLALGEGGLERGGLLVLGDGHFPVCVFEEGRKNCGRVGLDFMTGAGGKFFLGGGV